MKNKIKESATHPVWVQEKKVVQKENATAGKSAYKKLIGIVLTSCLFSLQVTAQQWQIYNDENTGTPINSTSTLAIDAQGNKWFGTSNGEVIRFDGINWKVFNSNNSGLPGGHRISSIAIDSLDNIWIGTSFALNAPGVGLLKYDNVNWTLYNVSNSGLQNNTVTCLAVDKSGSIWVGTWGGGVTKFDGIHWTTLAPGKNIHSIAVDDQNNIWFSTSQEIVKYDHREMIKYGYSQTIIPYYNGNGGITSIGFDTQGNKWFGISEDFDSGAAGGVTKFNDKNWTNYTPTNSDLPYGVHSIALDKLGNLWFVTSYWGKSAIVKYDGTNWQVYSEIYFGIPEPSFEKLLIDEEGNKWTILRNKGVMKFNENGFTTSNKNFPGAIDEISVYPNPAKDHITVFGTGSGTMSISNLSGAVVKVDAVKNNPSRFNISDLPDGIYFLKVYSNDKIAIEKFIKKN